MALFILFAMIAVPIAEIAVFIEVGGRIGVGSTLLVVVLTAMIGTALLRSQGLQTLARVQESLQAGRFPMAEVFDGLCLLVAGALLLTPGFVTDAAGLLLFVPAVRVGLRVLAGRYLRATGRVEIFTEDDINGPGGGPGRPADGTVIDAEFYEVATDERPNGKKDDDDDGNGNGPPRSLPG